MKLSVIICTYNPDEAYLCGALEALACQDLDPEVWELVIVDNNSSRFGLGGFDLQRISQAKVVKESKPGLTWARLCGIRETCGEYVVFVDDDNNLAPAYLSTVLEVFERETEVGCLGAATIRPVFEHEPSPDTREYLGMLALRDEPETEASSDLKDLNYRPWGAGISVRREVAEAYEAHVMENAASGGLGRSGKQLLSGEDIEISLVANKMGLKHRLVKALSLEHEISSSRLDKSYLRRLAWGHQYSNVILRANWGMENSLAKLCRQRLRKFKMTRNGFGFSVLLWELHALLKAHASLK